MATKGEKSCNSVAHGLSGVGGSSSSSSNICCSVAEDQCGHSSSNEIELEPQSVRSSSCFLVPAMEIDLESQAQVERDCRICHLGSESAAKDLDILIELGCSCKDDLAAAHKKCAEQWFKIKGNQTCEICGSTAKNLVVVGEYEVVEHSNETNAVIASMAARGFWQVHNILNILLGSMVFAFVISWLFHFKIPG